MIVARKIWLLLLLLTPFLWSQGNSTDNLGEFFQKWGKNASYDPRKKPLHITAGTLEGQEKDGFYRILAMEGVRVWQGEKSQPVLELFCERAVIWTKPAESVSKETSNNPLAKLDTAQFYAEGNVNFRWADYAITGKQIYFDLVKNKGIAIDSSVRGSSAYREKNIPLYVRAKQIKILSRRKFSAHDAFVSTCSFGDPHYRFAASLIKVTRKNEGTLVESYQNTIYGMGIPLFYLPYLAGGPGQTWPIKSVKIGKSSRFGSYIYTTWGGELYTPPGKTRNGVHTALGAFGGVLYQAPAPKKNAQKRLRWLLDIDTREKRGIALGPKILYQGDFNGSSFDGRLEGYYFRDQPVGKLGSGAPPDSSDPIKKNRYRIYGVHRQSFSDDWKLDMELSIISDPTMLTDFFEKVAREEKERETYGYLKKQWEDSAFTFLMRTNLNDKFQSLVAYLPQASYQLIYRPVFPEIIPNFYWSSKLEFSNALRKDDERNPSAFDEQRAVRADWNNIFYYRLNLDPIFLLPFAGGRISYFEKRRDGKHDIDRESGEFGVEVSTNFYRQFSIQNDFLDLNGLVHVLTPAFRYRRVYENTVSPDKLIPFDEMETVDKGQQLVFRLTNRLKTVRQGKIVDYLFLETEFSYFPERDLASAGISTTSLGQPVSNQWEKFGNLKFDFRWQIYRRAALNARAEYNFQVGDLETWNARLNATPAKSWQFYVDARYQLLSDAPTLVRRQNSLTTSAGLSYIHNAKWSFGCSVQYDFLDDFNSREFRELEFDIRRNFHRFALDLRFKRDFVDNDTSFTVDFYPLDLVDKGLRGNRQ